MPGFVSRARPWAGALFGLLSGLRTRARQWNNPLGSVGPGRDVLAGHASEQDRRVGYLGEIGMGGPPYWSVLLRDGALMHGVCSGIIDLEDGALRIALEQTHGGQALLAYDVAAQRIHTLVARIGAMQAAEFFSAAAVHPSECAHSLRGALAQSIAVQLHTVHGLRIDQRLPAPPPRLERRLGNGRLLEAQLLLPDDLRGASDPASLLYQPPYQLRLDGQETGLHVLQLDPPSESARGLCFALRGVRLAGARVVDGLWHVCHQGHWYSVRADTHAPFGTAERYPVYFLTLEAIGDDGLLRFRIAHPHYGPDGELPGDPPPPEVDQVVSWQEEPLRLRPDGDRISLQLPRRDAAQR